MSPFRRLYLIERWIRNYHSITPADLERARQSIARPEVQAEIARLNGAANA